MLMHGMMYYGFECPAELEEIFNEHRPPHWEYDAVEADMMDQGFDRWTLEHYGVLYPILHMEFGVGNFQGIGNFEAGHHGGSRRSGPSGGRGGRSGSARNTARHQHPDRSALTVTQMPTMEGTYSRPEGRRNTRRQPDRTPSPDDFAEEEEDGPAWSDFEDRDSSKYRDDDGLTTGGTHRTARHNEDHDSDAGSEYRSRYRPTELASTRATGRGHRAGKSKAKMTQGTAVDPDDIEEEDGDDEYRRQHAKGKKKDTEATNRKKRGTEATSGTKKGTETSGPPRNRY